MGLQVTKALRTRRFAKIKKQFGPIDDPAKIVKMANNPFGSVHAARGKFEFDTDTQERWADLQAICQELEDLEPLLQEVEDYTTHGWDGSGARTCERIAIARCQIWLNSGVCSSLNWPLYTLPAGISQWAGHALSCCATSSHMHIFSCTWQWRKGPWCEIRPQRL